MVNPTTTFQVFNMTLPPEGPVIVPQNIDMAIQQSYEIDITQLVNDKVISYISGAWIDNSANAHAVTLVCGTTQQSIIIPASSQGWYPLMAVNPPLFTVSQSAAGDLVKILFANFPMFPGMVGFGSGGGGGGGDVNITQIAGNDISGANLPVEIVAPNPVPTASVGPTITKQNLVLNGSSQTLLAAGDADHWAIIYNPTGNDTINVDLSGGAADNTDLPILAGQSLELPIGVANTVTVIGTNTQSVIAFGG